MAGAVAAGVLLLSHAKIGDNVPLFSDVFNLLWNV